MILSFCVAAKISVELINEKTNSDQVKPNFDELNTNITGEYAQKFASQKSERIVSYREQLH